MSRETLKAAGLDEMRRLMLTQGKVRTRADFARHFGVSRSTITHWIETLEVEGYHVEEDDQRRLYLDRSTYFTHLQLSRHESVMLMLSLRLLQQYLDKPNAHAVELLYKLGYALHKGLAPDVGRHIQDIAHAQRETLPDDTSIPLGQRVLEFVSAAWLDSRKLQIRYQGLRGRTPFSDVFHPYLLEPSAIGRSTYIIGFSERAGSLRVYKVERIVQRPLVLDETFEVPAALDIHRLLRGAWGIWMDRSEQPIEVTLRFSAHARKRVQENRWHPSETTDVDTEGRLIWMAQIDEPQEMLPWIRGWGADCEVLAPADLRDRMLGEVRRQMRLYGIEGAPRRFDEPDDALFSQLFGE